MTSDSSSCKTLSKYIISRSDTMAPLITMISSPLIIPEQKKAKMFLFEPYCIEKKLCLFSIEGVH